LRKTPDQHPAERYNNTSSLDSVRSSLPQLTGSAKASHTLLQTKAATPHASQAQQSALDKPKAAAVPSTGIKGGAQGEAVAKQGTPGLGSVKAGQGRGATSASGQPAAAPAHGEHATCGPTSTSAHGQPQELHTHTQKPVGSAPKAKRDESVSRKPESQTSGKHAASASAHLSKEGSQKAGAGLVKKRKSREQGTGTDVRVPLQQPKGIPALEGRARVQAGKAPKGHPNGTQPQGTSESQVEKRHNCKVSVPAKEGSSNLHPWNRSKSKSPDTEAESHGKSMPAQEDSTAGITSAKVHSCKHCHSHAAMVCCLDSW